VKKRVKMGVLTVDNLQGVLDFYGVM